MPVCHVCDAVDDFHDEDGLYYCNVCNTQSQSMRVLEQEDPYAGASSGRFNMSQSIKVPAKKRKELNIELTKLKPWWSYEAFQIILQAQTEYLIAMGMSKHLNEVVRMIWFKYLEVSGVAFCPTSKEQMLAYRKMAEERELEIRTRAEARLQAKRQKLAETSKKAAVEGDENDDLKPEGLDSGLETEENNNSEALDTNIDALSVKSYGSGKSGLSTASSRSRKSGCSDRNTVGLRKQRRSNDEPRIGIVSLKHLVCFLYIGLRYLGEPVIMNDLVRWISMGLLPYFGTEDLLPNYMVASMGTCELKQFLSRDIQSLQQFEKLWRSLVTFLSIKNLPPVDTTLLISRFITDLNLPREILSVTKRILYHKNSLANHTKKQRGKRRVHPTYEVEALAVITVALKLCFHLDDNFEHRQSRICRRIQRCCDAGSNYFVWEEWVSAQRFRCEEEQMNQVPTFPDDVFNLKSIKPFMNFQKNIYKKWLSGQTSYQAWSSNKMETRMEMMKPFLALSDKKEGETINTKPSTFVCLHPTHDATTDNIVMHDSHVSSYTKQAMLSKDFSVTSLMYATKSQITSSRIKHSSRKSPADSAISESFLPLDQEDEEAFPSAQGSYEIWKTQQDKLDSITNISSVPSRSSEYVPSTTDEENAGLLQMNLQSGTKRTWSQIKTLDCYSQQKTGQNSDTDKETNTETGESNKKYRKDLNNTKANKKHTCKKLRKKLAKMSSDHSYVLYPKMNLRKNFDRQLRYFHYSYKWLINRLSRLVGQECIELHTAVYRLEKALGYREEEECN